jgi:MFS family permease
MTPNAKLDRNVIVTGITSFFTDVSSEMVYPLIQAFINTMLASQKALIGPVLGVIEGVSESTASLTKIFAGYYSDRIQKRKMPTIAGYGLSAAAKLLLLLASLGWYFVLLARFFDRVGKGIRTSPRDALISESTPPEAQGRAFGFQRALDFAGATLGVLICYLIALHYLDPVALTLVNLKAFYLIFIISIVPAFLGVGCLFFARETFHPGMESELGKTKPKPSLNFWKYDRSLQIFFLVQLIFTLGNSSNQFLLLRSMNLGYALSTVILMYLFFNLSSTLLSSAFGSLSDRIGRRKVLAAGYVLYAAVYLSFGFFTPAHKYLLWIFWILYGVYYAMVEGVEKAFIAQMAPKESKATALGISNTIVGVGLLPASVLAGVLFSIHASAPFICGGIFALAAAGGLALFVKENDVRAKP